MTHHFNASAMEKRFARFVLIEKHDKKRYDRHRRRRYEKIYDELYLRQGICPNCEGDGKTDAQHPLWGSPSCPEPYVTVICYECNGSGKFDRDT